jgi:hypothetical protein
LIPDKRLWFVYTTPADEKKDYPMQTAVDAHPNAGCPTSDIDVLITASEAGSVANFFGLSFVG